MSSVCAGLCDLMMLGARQCIVMLALPCVFVSKGKTLKTKAGTEYMQQRPSAKTILQSAANEVSQNGILPTSHVCVFVFVCAHAGDFVNGQ